MISAFIYIVSEKQKKKNIGMMRPLV